MEILIVNLFRICFFQDEVGTGHFKRGVLGQSWYELVRDESEEVKENLNKTLKEISNLDATYQEEQEIYSRLCEGDKFLLQLLDDYNSHKTGTFGIVHINRKLFLGEKYVVSPTYIPKTTPKQYRYIAQSKILPWLHEHYPDLNCR